MKSYLSNPKYEIISKLQILISKYLEFDAWKLFGIWCLGFGNCLLQTFAHQGEKKPLLQGALGTAKPCQCWDKIHPVALFCQAES
jgi:hypothetical protein